MSQLWTTPGAMLAGAAAAIGASACCAGPLLLVVLGIGGAWGSRLTVLEVYQPYFVAAALACFGYAFFKLHRKPMDCAPGKPCAIPVGRRRQKVTFWLVAFAAGMLMSLPLYAPLFH